MPTNNILFRVDANPTIGWGHFYRSLALAQMLRAEFHIRFAMANPANNIRAIINETGFNLLPLPDLEYTSPDHRGDREFECDVTGLLNEIDIVITDGYWFGEKYREGLRKEKVKIAVIEDDGKGKYTADLLINHAPGINKSDYQTPPNTLFALGLEFALLRPAFLNAAKQTQSLAADRNEVFICFGGADAHGLAITMTEMVLENTDLKAHLIISPDHGLYSNVTALEDIYPQRLRLSANLNENEMVKSMQEARFAIVPASGILYECIACNLPAIAGYYAENQKNIYFGLIDSDAIIPADNFLNFKDHKIICQMDEPILQSIQKEEAYLIDGYSDHRFLKLFKDLIHA